MNHSARVSKALQIFGALLLVREIFFILLLRSVRVQRVSGDSVEVNACPNVCIDSALTQVRS